MFLKKWRMRLAELFDCQGMVPMHKDERDADHHCFLQSRFETIEPLNYGLR